MQNDIINKLKHLPDDCIGDGIYTAFEWYDGKLVRFYIGSKVNGPMLQYNADGKGKYNGKNEIDFVNGCWTNLYSRGNFGKKYAFGGNWSGHNKNMHSKLMAIMPVNRDKKSEILLDDDGNVIPIPDGIKGDVTMSDMDCSGSWSIWYRSAKEALSNRLKMDEIINSSLPDITKKHLFENETDQVIDALRDVIEAYGL